MELVILMPLVVYKFTPTQSHPEAEDTSLSPIGSHDIPFYFPGTLQTADTGCVHKGGRGGMPADGAYT